MRFGLALATLAVATSQLIFSSGSNFVGATSCSTKGQAVASRIAVTATGNITAWGYGCDGSASGPSPATYELWSGTDQTPSTKLATACPGSFCPGMTGNGQNQFYLATPVPLPSPSWYWVTFTCSVNCFLPLINTGRSCTQCANLTWICPEFSPTVYDVFVVVTGTNTSVLPPTLPTAAPTPAPSFVFPGAAPTNSAFAALSAVFVLSLYVF